MMRLLRITMMLGLVASLAATAPAAEQARPAQGKSPFEGTPSTAAKTFEAKVFRNRKGEELPYRFLKPLKATPGKAYPLILFMHGAGERGRDNRRICKNALPVFSSPQFMEQYPCYVIAPQVPDDRKWVEVDWSALVTKAPAEPSQSIRLALELLESVRKEYKIDPDRIYVTGLSMGGYGTWDVICRYPDLFAAAVPVCGGGDPTKVPAAAKMPIWAFHGDADPIVPVVKSREMVEAFKKNGNKVQYTEYPGVDHNAWTPTYDNPELYKWLFAQKKSKPMNRRFFPFSTMRHTSRQ